MDVSVSRKPRLSQVLYSILFWAVPIVIILCMVLFFRVTRISGTSMNPTLEDGQFVVGMFTPYNPLAQPKRSDVAVVYHEDQNLHLIKRVIALPGDTLAIVDNQIYVNGEAVDEPYLGEPMKTRDIPQFTLGADEYFVLGDNRNISADSRMYGCFSGDDIVMIVDMEHQTEQFALVIGLIVFALVWIWLAPEELPEARRHTACLARQG